MPKTPPIVTTTGLTRPATQYTLLEEDHARVAHSAEPSRADGVRSETTKLAPTTVSILLDSVRAAFATAW